MDYEEINGHMTEQQKSSLRAAVLQQMAGTTMTYDEINNCLSEQQKTSLMTAALQTMVEDASGAPQEYTNYDDVNNRLSEQQKSSLMAAALMYLKDNSGSELGIPLSVSQTGVLTRSNDSFTFTSPPEATRIEYDASDGLYGLQYAFYSCQGLTELDLSSVTEIIGPSALLKCFYSCLNLVSVDFSGLETINGGSALDSAFQYCSALASVDFSSLRRVTSYNAMYKAFEGCRNLTSLSFPSFDASVSRDSSLNGMLTSVTGCTVHFPASQESTMSSWSSVTNGFGGTNTTVLFDL